MSGTGDQKLAPILVLRRRLKMTQGEFAVATGVTVSTVNRWEAGHIEPSRLARRTIEALVATTSKKKS